MIVQRRGVAYFADIAGMSVAMRRVKDELFFELPDGQGSFRGRVEGDRDIVGHWISPPYVGYGFQYASPVHFKPDGENLWSSQVILLNDTFTLYLLLKNAPDGSMTVVLQNPERDYGAFIGAERSCVTARISNLWPCDPIGKEWLLVATGLYDADNKTISLYFPNRGGTYDFQHDDSSGFYPRGKDSLHYAYYPPLARGLWLVNIMDEVGIPRTGIEKLSH